MENFSKHDTPEQRQQIRVLKARGYQMIRKSQYQWKFQEINYYNTTGTITIDPGYRYKDKGFDALVALLEERYSKPQKPAGLLILDGK